MRIARILAENELRWARIDGDRAEFFSGAPWLGGAPTGRFVAFRESDLRAPVEPFKILCVGRNYAAHAKELGNEVPAEPLLFLKPKSALIGPGGVVELPSESARVEHEAELGVVIGKAARRVSRDRALDYVFGYTCVCDVTARDLQRKDGQWSRAKGFDTFCPCGPFVSAEINPALGVFVETKLNGERKQHGFTRDFIFPVPRLLVYITAAMALEPGDLIPTGTPAGVGPMSAGDTVEVSIEGLGVLKNPVEAGK